MVSRKCPFCGFKEGWVTSAPLEKTKYAVKCSVCDSYGPPSNTNDGAIRKWNGYLNDIDIKNKDKFNKAIKESLSTNLLGRSFKSDEGIEIYFSPDEYIELIDPETDKWIYQFHKIPNPGEIINMDGESVNNIFDTDPYLYYSDDGDYLEIINNERVEYTIYLDELEEINEMDMGGVSSPMSTLNNTAGTGNAQPASQAAMTGSQQGSPNAKGSGDKFDNSMGPYTQDGKKRKKKKTKKKNTNESALNPYDEIGKMMAKKMNVPLYFEKGNDSKHKKQKNVEKMNNKYKISTFKDFKKKKNN